MKLFHLQGHPIDWANKWAYEDSEEAKRGYLAKQRQAYCRRFRKNDIRRRPIQKL